MHIVREGEAWNRGGTKGLEIGKCRDIIRIFIIIVFYFWFADSIAEGKRLFENLEVSTKSVGLHLINEA